MTEQEINKAIAEVCGTCKWRQAYEYYGTKDYAFAASKDGLRAKIGDAIPVGEPESYNTIDYYNDLNAMHEAEKTLSSGQICDYQSALFRGVWWTVTHSTASQRAEAFLRAVGKWVDSEQKGNQ